MLLAHPHIANFDLSSLQILHRGRCRLAARSELRGFECDLRLPMLVEGYGLSETSPVVRRNPLGGPRTPPREGSIGLPLPAPPRFPDARSMIRTPRARAGRDRGDCIAGPQVMTGYWNKLEDTVFIVGWLLFPSLPRCRLHGRKEGHRLHRRSHQGHDQRLGFQGLSAADRGCGADPSRGAGMRGGRRSRPLSRARR